MHRWLLATRPRTLILVLAPISAALALVIAEQHTISIGIALITLCTAAAIQIGTNLYNDAADFERGTDTPDRLGPARAAAQGWFTAAHIRRAAHFTFLCAFLFGLILVAHGGWPLLLLGLAAIAAGYAYTSGPYPIAYSPFGELYVLVFFGVVTVAGTYYLQTLHWQNSAVLLGAAFGLPACAVLLVNNYRDFETDQRAGRHTLCHVLGRPRARLLYAALLFLPIPLLLHLQPAAWALLLCAIPAAAALSYRLWAIQDGRELNALLGQTALYQGYLAVLFGVGVWWE